MIIKCRAMCSDEYDVPVTQEQLNNWKNGVLIQNAMSNIPADMRELLISGTCPKCWDRLFKDVGEY